ncbi:hypothetical protein PDENDC454_04339 [Paenibacillus dendritiformis C454]|uniref:Uncharacterized protein n=1 Tax=Paenibacillus dendritiformis C454 TaxID=1131935 RepID=H3SBI2_9BACL|nr:hypothetical protein [Paenibacillus dendritiformis]EHQ63665.1 hypothetical protein PDENDC454_04339 [Paenibacillus dendritiformis C454]
MKISLGEYTIEGTPVELAEYDRLTEQAEAKKERHATTTVVIECPPTMDMEKVSQAIRDAMMATSLRCEV